MTCQQKIIKKSPKTTRIMASQSMTQQLWQVMAKHINLAENHHVGICHELTKMVPQKWLLNDSYEGIRWSIGQLNHFAHFDMTDEAMYVSTGILIILADLQGHLAEWRTKGTNFHFLDMNHDFIRDLKQLDHEPCRLAAEIFEEELKKKPQTAMDATRVYKDKLLSILTTTDHPKQAYWDRVYAFEPRKSEATAIVTAYEADLRSKCLSAFEQWKVQVAKDPIAWVGCPYLEPTPIQSLSYAYCLAMDDTQREYLAMAMISCIKNGCKLGHEKWNLQLDSPAERELDALCPERNRNHKSTTTTTSTVTTTTSTKDKLDGFFVVSTPKKTRQPMREVPSAKPAHQQAKIRRSTRIQHQHNKRRRQEAQETDTTYDEISCPKKR